MRKTPWAAAALVWMLSACVHSAQAEPPRTWKIVTAGAPSSLQAFRLNTATGQTWSKDGNNWKIMPEPAPPTPAETGAYECNVYAANSGVWALRFNRNTGEVWILRGNGWNKTQFDTPPAGGAMPGVWQIAGDNTETNLVAILLNSATGQGWQLSSGNWTTVGDSILLPAGTAETYTCHVQDAPNGWWALRTNLKNGQCWRLSGNQWTAIAMDVQPSADSAAQALWHAEMSGSGSAMGAVVFNAATGQTWQWADTLKLISDPAPLPPANMAKYDMQIYDAPGAWLALRWNTQTGQSWLAQNNAWQEMQYSLLPIGDAGAAAGAWTILVTAPNKDADALLLNSGTGQTWKRTQAQWLPLTEAIPRVGSAGDSYAAAIRNVGDNWTGIRWNLKTGQSWLLAADTWTELKCDQPPGFSSAPVPGTGAAATFARPELLAAKPDQPAAPNSDSAPLWKVTLVGNGSDAEAILINTSTGQAYRKYAGGWTSIADAAKPALAPAGTYQCSAFEEAAGWAAVRWNTATGESWSLGPGAWQAMPADQPLTAVVNPLPPPPAK